MKATTFDRKVAGIVTAMKKMMANRQVEDVRVWVDGEKFKDLSQYGTTCERCMEANLDTSKVLYIKGKEVRVRRETTFTYDFSVAEWMGGVKDVLDTFKTAATSWKDDVTYMAELILVINFKSWEMAARNYNNWGILYAELYYALKDLVYDYYSNDEEKVSYLFHYLD